MLASLKTLIPHKIVLKAVLHFSLDFLRVIGRFYVVYIHGQLSEQFSGSQHRRLSEQLLESQAAIGKPGQAP
jgi:hypothetical protein